MRDADRRAALGEPVDGASHLGGVGRVQPGEGLVEHHDRRVAQQRAGDGDALPLATGDRGAALTDGGVVALRQGMDPCIELRQAASLGDLLIGGVEASVADVVGDGAGEQHAVLQYERDVATQVGDPDLPQVHAVEADLADDRVHAAHQQARQGGLAAAGRADERDLLPGGNAQREVAEGRVAVVGGGHALEGDLSADVPEVDGVARVGDVDAGLHEVGDPLAGGGGARDAAGVLGQVAQRLHRGLEVRGEQHEVAGRHRALHDPPAAEGDDDGGGEPHHDVGLAFQGGGEAA